MPRSREELLVKEILGRLEGKRMNGQGRRLPAWAGAAILGAGLNLAACSPPTQEPCEDNCNNTNNANNVNNVNNYNNDHPLYGINNVNNYNNINNTLYGIQDGGTDDADLDCPNCEYMAPLYSAPGDAGDEDAGDDPVPLYGKK